MKWLYRLKVSTRLSLLIGALIAGLLFFAAVAWWSLLELRVNGPLYKEVSAGKDLVADILPPPRYIIESYLVTMQLRDAARRNRPNTVRTLKTRLEQLHQEFEQRQQFWMNQPLDAELRDVFLRQSYEPAHRFFRLAFDSFLPAMEARDLDAMDKVFLQMASAYEEHRSFIDRVVTMTNERNAAVENKANQRIGTVTQLLIGSLSVTVLGGIIIGAFVGRSVVRPLGGEPSVAIAACQRIARGDLSASVPVQAGDRDSLLANLRQMSEDLRVLFLEVRHAAQDLAGKVHTLHQIGEQVRARANQQYDQSAKIAAAIEEVAANTRGIADKTVEGYRMAEQAERQISDTVATIQQLSSEVDRMASAIVSTGAEVSALVERSRQIEGIVRSINEIAEQTNLLALNAAIEAARAGDAGRGFAVVADEVRKLAENTAAKTQDIAQLISSIQSEIDRAVANIRNTSEQAKETRSKMLVSTASLDEVTQATAALQLQNQEIMNGVNEEKIAVDQIAQSLEEITVAAEGSLTVTESLATAAKELDQLSSRLFDKVDCFKL